MGSFYRLTFSRDANKDDKLGLIYPVRVRLDAADVLVDGKRVPIAPGMAVNAEIITGDGRVIEYLLSPILRYQHESGREMRRLFSLLLALVVWTTGVAVGQTIPVPPVEFPFDASSASSSIDATVRIVGRRSYYFDLQFHYSGQNDMPKVRELVGGGARFADGRYAEPGIIVPVHLEVVEILGGDRTRTVYDKTNETQGRYAHNLDGSYARVIAGIILTPGLYKVRASTTQETSVLSGISTRFAITYDARFPPIKE